MPMSNVPVLSLPQQLSDPVGFAAALGASFTRFGFAIVSGHGVPEPVIAEGLAATKAFFALPEPVKRAYHVQGGGGQRGYTPFGVEAAKGAREVDLKEFWHVGRTLPVGHRFSAEMPANLWPSELPAFEPALKALYDALDQAGLRILTGVARYLKLPEDYFADAVAEGNSVLRLLHYPPVAGTPAGIRAEAHEDINVITLLLGAEEAGLQLLDRDGRWLDVTPPDGALVVNVGDMLQRLTNRTLPSTTHRVINPSPERAHLPRYSIPFFQHFRPDFLITPLDRGAPETAEPPITAQAFLAERLREIRLT